MSGTITSANATIMLAIASVFPTPQQLQGFAADDIFNTDALSSAETLMGVDGRLSAGFVFVPIVQGYTLQADSDSNDLFDQWYQAQQTARELFPASGIVLLTSIGKKWQMNRGFLTTFPPIPDGGKYLKPRKYGITWESVNPSVT